MDVLFLLLEDELATKHRRAIAFFGFRQKPKNVAHPRKQRALSAAGGACAAFHLMREAHMQSEVGQGSCEWPQAIRGMPGSEFEPRCPLQRRRKLHIACGGFFVKAAVRSFRCGSFSFCKRFAGLQKECRKTGGHPTLDVLFLFLEGYACCKSRVCGCFSTKVGKNTFSSGIWKKGYTF